jgi:chromate reductase, NAD(P)H dehydrogenase (quinone)
MKQVLAIIGSATTHSANLHLVQQLAVLAQNRFRVNIYNGLKQLPHFDPELSVGNTPPAVLDLRQQIAAADGIIISTPEYVFSIPSGLKNAIEWCVATTIFAHKPTGLITAAASGLKGHEELQLIMRTVEARFTGPTTLLIQGIKGKLDADGAITDAKTRAELLDFVQAFAHLLGQIDRPNN